MSNDAFSQALRLLAHPASVVALLALLVNDHLLRRVWPGWGTGKLGDFAWLFFMPFVAAALLGLVVGRRAQARTVGALACLLIGGLFALAKTVPDVHAVVVAAASTLFGFPVGWRRDPGDLIALVSVFAAWRLWQRDARRRRHHPGDAPPTRAPARGVPLLVAAMLLTVANSPAPERGIVAVMPTDGVLVACSTYGSYGSADGGRTWAQLLAPTPIPHPTLPDGTTPTAGPTPTALPTPTLEPGAPTPIPYALGEVCEPVRGRYYEFVIQGQLVEPVGPTPTVAPTPAPGEPTPPPGPTVTPGIYLVGDERSVVLYRFQPDNWIQRSDDGGATWTTEVDFRAQETASPSPDQPGALEALFDGVVAMMAHRSQSCVPGPLGGVIDAATGRTFFSMGTHGLLVRDTDGEYQWIAVGEFRRPPED